ncbi:MAG: hypothetical protein GY716_18120 [bacterium]|nr:hypothetical protein [bacterium]
MSARERIDLFLIVACSMSTAAADERETGLFRAVLHDRPEAVGRLLSSGADPNATSTYGTILEQAILYDRAECARLLVDAGAALDWSDPLIGWSYLHLAAESSSVELVTTLLDAGMDVDGKTAQGWTPLYKATHRGHLRMVELLVDRGADLWVVDVRGQTPLDFAELGAKKLAEAREQYEEPGVDFAAVVRYLTEHGVGRAP